MAKTSDLTGQSFGEWMVLGRAENSAAGDYRYKCQCSCGKEKTVYASSLRNGSSRSCGHLARRHRRQNTIARYDEYLGARFGLLTVKSVRTDETDAYCAYAVCSCACGNAKEIRIHSLMSGNTKSCGCLSAQIAGELSHARAQLRKETT